MRVARGEEHRRSCLMSECLLNIQVEIRSGLLELGRKFWARVKIEEAIAKITYREPQKKQRTG